MFYGLKYAFPLKYYQNQLVWNQPPIYFSTRKLILKNLSSQKKNSEKKQNI